MILDSRLIEIVIGEDYMILVITESGLLWLVELNRKISMKV